MAPHFNLLNTVWKFLSIGLSHFASFDEIRSLSHWRQNLLWQLSLQFFTNAEVEDVTKGYQSHKFSMGEILLGLWQRESLNITTFTNGELYWLSGFVAEILPILEKGKWAVSNRIPLNVWSKDESVAYVLNNWFQL